MRFVPALVVGALGATLALTGCGAPPVSTPSPTPVPTFLCTPEAGGVEYPCDQRSYDDMKAKDALYAEAEAVYRRFFEEDNRIQLSGDYRLTPTIESTTSGTFREALLDVYAQLADMRITGSGGPPALTWLRRQPGLSREGSIVALESCVDATGVAVLQAGKPAGTGFINRNTYFFVRDGDALKIQTAEGGQVQEC